MYLLACLQKGHTIYTGCSKEVVPTESKFISRKSCLMPCLKLILNCFALEHSAFKTKHLKVSSSSDNPAFRGGPPF